MSRKIKFNSLHIMFRLFAWLADKSGGWRVFVKPKLILGTIIIASSGVYGQNNKLLKTNKNQLENKTTKLDKTVSLVADENVFCYVTEYMPTYPGDEEALLKYIEKNLKYPAEAFKNKIQGRVIVRFVITKTGKVDNVFVVRSLSPECDKEAVRVIRSFPNWIPGKQNGKKVAVYYTLPVTFKLE